MRQDSDSLVNEDAMNVLKMSKGVVRVPLQDLGPALFNRDGEDTSGQHCLKLGRRILTLEGFATFRYVAGFCHEPDPADPLAVSRHGNKMQAKDTALPRLPSKPLKGVFAKTHLVTFLQMYQNGQIPEWAPKASSQSQQGPSKEELQDVLDHGIFMHVFPWSVVRDHSAAAKKLMAADNFDHGHGLADSEMRCIKAVRVAIAASSKGTLHVPAGLSQWDVVLRHVMQMSGQRWREQDIGCFWDFSKSTLEGHFDLLQDIWSIAECESVLRVEAAWFGAIAKLNPKLQWTRSAIVVAHILSDRDLECSVVAGNCVAGAITKSVVKKIRDRDSALNQDWEEWMQAVLEKYWTAWSHEPASRPIARDVGLPAVAAFLDRAGRFVAFSTMAAVPEKKVKLEGKLRQAVEPGWSGPMPKPVTDLGEEKKNTNWTDKLDAEPQVVADSKGRAIVSVKREAQEKNLEVGALVTAKRRRKNGVEEILATVTEISDKGVAISWEAAGKSGSNTDVLPVSAIELSQKTEKDPASSQEDMLKHCAIKWAQCSTEVNQDMLLHVTASILYQAYVARSSAHEDLHIINDGGVIKMFAIKEMKAGALVMLPFGDIVDNKRYAPGSVPVTLEIAGEKGGQTARVEYKICSKPTPRRTTSTDKKAVVLVPFWVLATKPVASKKLQAASSQAVAKLQYKTTTVNVPAAPQVEKRSAKGTTNIVMKTTCLTNSEVVAKGAWLVVADGPP